MLGLVISCKIQFDAFVEQSIGRDGSVFVMGIMKGERKKE
jgi:hypothetical protein